MKSTWSDERAREFGDDLLAMRVYTSRLLGNDPDLVMHGGGNTSVKIMVDDFFGDAAEILYVKGSGWDLGTIEAEGFAPVRMDVLRRLAALDELSDSDMVRQQRLAMLDPSAPSPSVETILHAILPFTFVDHSHADAVVALTNTADGEARIRDLYGDRVLIVPYVMPGFVLAKKIYDMTRDFSTAQWQALDGMILMNHGVFTFNDDAKESYERMIRLVDEAEQELERRGALAAVAFAKEPPVPDLMALAQLRKNVSSLRGAPVLASLSTTPTASGFAALPTATAIANRGPLTPDHVIRTKRLPLIICNDPASSLETFAASYHSYFEEHDPGDLVELDRAPRWALWPGVGTLAFGRSAKETNVISDIVQHTVRAIQWAEHLGGWQALDSEDIFDVEYWELEQAKLAKAGKAPRLQGRVAVVTGAASGIGKACAEALAERGAAVVGLDIDPRIRAFEDRPGRVGLVCDVTDPGAVASALEATATHFGGIDMVISNAGYFPTSQPLDGLDDDTWRESLDVNLTSHQRLLRAAVPFLKHGIDPSVVMIGSKNVHAPGPGAAAYSAAKAGQTQLARVAALELAPAGIRVNVIHPDAVFDTGIWSPGVIAERAEHYGLTPEQYRTKNLLALEVTSADVAAAVCAIVSPSFRATTGAQIPVDGGNDRVI